MPEIYIRGTRIKYICVPDEVADLVPRDSDTKKFVPNSGRCANKFLFFSVSRNRLVTHVLIEGVEDVVEVVDEAHVAVVAVDAAEHVVVVAATENYFFKDIK